MGKLKELYAQIEELESTGNSEDAHLAAGMKLVLDKLNDDSYMKNMDWSMLRAQKLSLLLVIEILISTGEDEKADDLTGILHLIDAMQDFAVDELGIDSMHVFDDEAEDKAEALPSTKQVLLCPNCSSDRIQIKVWSNPNNPSLDKETDNSTEDTYCHCLDCNLNGDYVAADVKRTADVIGFQVVADDDSGEIHPSMDASFCLYNLSQAKEMLNYKHNQSSVHDSEWRLLAIWSEDVEDPTFMFEGDPRK